MPDEIKYISGTDGELAEKMKRGEIDGPVITNNCFLVKIRITGTGQTTRKYKGEDRIFNRAPGVFLSDKFLKMCNGLPAVYYGWDSALNKFVGHPTDGELDYENWKKYIVGTVMLAWVDNDEVWGVAKVFTLEVLKDILDGKVQSTSPFVESDNIETANGIIEERLNDLNHIAFITAGHWDQNATRPAIKIGELLFKKDPASTESEKKDKEEFIRLATDEEGKSPTAKNKAFNSFPDKEGMEKVYMPYGEKGRGFYYTPIKKADEATIDKLKALGVISTPDMKDAQKIVDEILSRFKADDGEYDNLKRGLIQAVITKLVEMKNSGKSEDEMSKILKREYNIPDRFIGDIIKQVMKGKADDAAPKELAQKVVELHKTKSYATIEDELRKEGYDIAKIQDAIKRADEMEYLAKADADQNELRAKILELEAKLTLGNPSDEEKKKIVAEVEKLKSHLSSKQDSAPAGMENVVKALKKEKSVDNPFAVAWAMKNKGDALELNPENVAWKKDEASGGEIETVTLRKIENGFVVSVNYKPQPATSVGGAMNYIPAKEISCADAEACVNIIEELTEGNNMDIETLTKKVDELTSENTALKAKVDDFTKKADELTKKADEATKKADEDAKKAEDDKKKADDDKKKADADKAKDEELAKAKEDCAKKDSEIAELKTKKDAENPMTGKIAALKEKADAVMTKLGDAATPEMKDLSAAVEALTKHEVDEHGEKGEYLSDDDDEKEGMVNAVSEMAQKADESVTLKRPDPKKAESKFDYARRVLVANKGLVPEKFHCLISKVDESNFALAKDAIADMGKEVESRTNKARSTVKGAEVVVKTADGAKTHINYGKS